MKLETKLLISKKERLNYLQEITIGEARYLQAG
jgi:hypothetical protein